jgi:hypothetical protein
VKPTSGFIAMTTADRMNQLQRSVFIVVPPGDPGNR